MRKQGIKVPDATSLYGASVWAVGMVLLAFTATTPKAWWEAYAMVAFLLTVGAWWNGHAIGMTKS